MLYAGKNIFYCVVFINLHNLPVIWSLGYFQIRSVNNAVMNTFLNKMFLCISNYSIRDSLSVPNCQKFLYFVPLPILMIP